MAQDRSTTVVIGVVILLAVVAVFFLIRGGDYQYKLASREQPGYYGECCTCTRATATIKGDVRPQTREVLFRNVPVEDCASACADAHLYSKRPYVKYDVNSFVSNDAECRTSLPEPRWNPGAGHDDQPASYSYYVAS